ncbi:Nucleolysin TIAR [Zancudomyces culisetae]|uniref:Nucleolysin TIAR n=1 Tax=Zancudomyces culisetae TaxID=1213189 RepID=A0A1R1PX10_ZANCU|nr:Nucleolysin TIAR [Zancudomyces culisetae]|eukprot:OMH85520.1 Nucleolysin TIAR [Zancudomyces culisetae]
MSSSEVTVQNNSIPETDPNSQNGFGEAVYDSASKTIYVGNLDTKADEALLTETFGNSFPVQSVKIFQNKKVRQVRFIRIELDPNSEICYAFVEFTNREDAETAISTMDGTQILDFPIKTKWAQSNNQNYIRRVPAFTKIFVGNLGPQMDNEGLAQLFSFAKSLRHAHVVIDKESGNSRGYGFVTFAEYRDARFAINKMNGAEVDSKQIRVNWATGKDAQTNGVRKVANSTLYCGDLDPSVTENQLSDLFSKFGTIMKINFYIDHGYAFVRMDNHYNASNAINNVNGLLLNGKNMKCSFAKIKQSKPLTQV